MSIKMFAIKYLEPILPKFVRRLWCSHIGWLKGIPDPNDLVELSEPITIKCTRCGRSKLTTLFCLIFNSNIEEWFNADL